MVWSVWTGRRANDGDLALVETADNSPRAYKELACRRGILNDMAWPHVVLADGRVYCKDRGGRLRCFALSPEARAESGRAITQEPSGARPTVVVAGALDETRLATEWDGGQKDAVFSWRQGYGRRKAAGSFARSARRISLSSEGDAGLDALGRMSFQGAGSFSCAAAAGPLLVACGRSGEFTLEAVITPANVTQTGPARVLSFSRDPYLRNFTLGQEGDKLLVRLRTDPADKNGMKHESDVGKVKKGVPLHVIVSFRDGELAAYVNGKRTLQQKVSGRLSSWDPHYQFLFGNEADGGRGWSGLVHAVAYSSAFVDERAAAARFGRMAAKTK
jgi:hypothetical protein